MYDFSGTVNRSVAEQLEMRKIIPNLYFRLPRIVRYHRSMLSSRQD